MQFPALTQHAKVGRKLPKQNESIIAVESCPEVGGATHMPGVYKIPMVRMWITTDERPDVQV